MVRRSIVAVLMAAGATVAAIVPAAPAHAVACTIQHYCYTTWYTSAAKTVVAGQKYEDCNGNTTTWGTRTPYVTFTENPC
jgi:uncharacterized protein DUF6289